MLSGLPGLLSPHSPAATLTYPAALMTTGRLIYVDSTRPGAADDNYGDMATNPKATLTGALRRCRAGRGDIIVLMPGHTETVRTAGGITVNVAGVTIVGLGTGAYRPTLTFTGSTAASVVISAASVHLANIIGVPAIADLSQPFDVQAADCTLELEWQDASSTVDARRAVLATAAHRLRLALTYRGFDDAAHTLGAVQLNGCDHVALALNAWGQAASGWVEFVSTSSNNVAITGSLYASGVTDGSHNVSDTVGESTWHADVFDMAAGQRLLGGSGAALANVWQGAESMLTVLRALGVVDLSDELRSLSDRLTVIEDALETLTED